jgi:photosystem II stability/assembly factor-like uncharacterized protein
LIIRVQFIFIFLLICLSLISCTPEPVNTSIDLNNNDSESKQIHKKSTAKIEPLNLTNIFMFNDLEGWSIVNNSILRTKDGGKSWLYITPKNEKIVLGQHFFMTL